MVPFELIVAPLSKALGLSLVVERGLEFSKNLLESRLFGSGAPVVPKLKDAEEAIRRVSVLADVDESAQRVEGASKKPAETAKLAKEREDLLKEIDRTRDPKRREELLQRYAARAGEWDEHVPVETVLVEPATDPDDGWTLRTFVLQLLGFAAGILLAKLADVQLFTALLTGVGRAPAPWVDHVLTGLFIGGGSGPAHLLIRFITERKQVVREAVEAAEGVPAGPAAPAAPAAPAVVVRPGALATEWVDIPYEGGVDRDTLQHVHRRPPNKKPNLIVYHHTAMNSASPFEDIVKVIKSRGFLTAYHCVVLADGSIRPFCRWDRFGSHAKDHNLLSLGIAFHGSFEADPRVPDSNPDGRLGVLQPTEAQLDAGARVVALWIALYGISVDFGKAIIPHNQIAPKACPGSRFPKDRFRKRVEDLHDAWQRTPDVMARIEAFRQKPYLDA
jgi:hypothetical protein